MGDFGPRRSFFGVCEEGFEGVGGGSGRGEDAGVGGYVGFGGLDTVSVALCSDSVGIGALVNIYLGHHAVYSISIYVLAGSYSSLDLGQRHGECFYAVHIAIVMFQTEGFLDCFPEVIVYHAFPALEYAIR